MGAYLALQAAGEAGKIMIFSCDGQNDVIDEIVNGNITQTAVYSTWRAGRDDPCQKNR